MQKSYKIALPLVLTAILLVSSIDSNAQTRRPRRGGGAAPAATPAPAQQTPPATTTPAPATTTNTGTGGRRSRGASANNAQQNVQTAPVQQNNTVSNAPTAPKFIYDTATTGTGLGEPTKPSLRSEVALKREIKDLTPLAYENLREDDALFSAVVWREIDCREKINRSFLYNGKEDNGDQRFFAILMQAILNPDSSQRVSAFSVDDDRFTTEISPGKLMRDLAFEYDTIPDVPQADGTLATTITKRAKLNVDSVYKYRLKEQYIFDKESSRLFVRIIGICPIARMKPTASAPAVDKPLFWVYYPDIRSTLAKFEAYNEKNYSARMTWEEVFESHFFSSHIIKSTLNNTQNKTLTELYAKNPMLKLLEGEKVKEKIFNYEQDLWSY